MTLPRLTHLRMAVLTELLRGTARGRDVRERLSGHGIRQSGPAFYQLMAGLEEDGYVSGWYEQQVVDGQIFRERHYKVLAGGRRAWQECRTFYDKTLRKPEPARGA